LTDERTVQIVQCTQRHAKDPPRMLAADSPKTFCSVEYIKSLVIGLENKVKFQD